MEERDLSGFWLMNARFSLAIPTAQPVSAFVTQLRYRS
jgi:hypothetical protein